MKIKVALVAAVVISLPLLAHAGITGGLKAVVPSTKLNPQPEPPLPLRGMNPAQFKALPDTAKLEIGGKTVTKAEFVKAMEQARTEAKKKTVLNTQKATVAIQQFKSTQMQQQLQKIASSNAEVQAKMAAVGTGTPQSAKIRSYSTNPQITGVYGMVTPKGLVQVTGQKFGDKKGKVVITGNFPNARDRRTLQPEVQKWYDDALAFIIPEVSGALHQQVTITVTTASGQTTQTSAPFKALIDVQKIPRSLLTSVNCSSNASFHNACNKTCESPMVCGNHQDLDGAAYSSGTDTYTFDRLPAGFEIMPMGFFNTGYKVNGKTVTMTWDTSMDLGKMSMMTMMGGMVQIPLPADYAYEVYASGPAGVQLK